MKTKIKLLAVLSFITLCSYTLLGQNCKLIKSATFTAADNPTVILSGVLNRFTADTVPINLNQWNYVAMVIGTNQYQIYINGKLKYTGVYSSSGMSWYQLHLGAHYYTDFGGWFNGWIDELRISNTARTATAVSNYYASGVPFVSDANTLGLWHFDQTTGSQINSATGPSGTLGNTTWDSNGKFGSCLYFNGTNAVSTINMNIPINNMTCEFWIKPHTLQSSYSVDWYGMNTSGFRIDLDTINNAKYSWSTGETGKSITVDPTNYKYIWVSNGNCKDTVYLNPDTKTIHDTVFVSTSPISDSGLVAYYPFNGNANDQSKYKKNGIVNGATLTTDRFGNQNSAYYFDGINNNIQIKDSLLISNNFTISFWANSENTSGKSTILCDGSSNAGGNDFLINFRGNDLGIRADKNAPLNYEDNSPATLQHLDFLNKWVQVVWTMTPTYSKVYVNGKLITQINQAGTNKGYHNPNSYIGARHVWGNTDDFFHGKLDDIIMYNRVLTDAEISTLYTGNAIPISAYDTVLVSVTDTLVINAVFTGINPPNNINVIKIYPNPAKDHITIDYGNYQMQAGYALKILNALGQVVFTTSINQQQSYVDLSSWSARGIYYVHLIDDQGKTVELRKIVLQ